MCVVLVGLEGSDVRSEGHSGRPSSSSHLDLIFVDALKRFGCKSSMERCAPRGVAWRASIAAQFQWYFWIFEGKKPIKVLQGTKVLWRCCSSSPLSCGKLLAMMHWWLKAEHMETNNQSAAVGVGIEPWLSPEPWWMPHSTMQINTWSWFPSICSKRKEGQ